MTRPGCNNAEGYATQTYSVLWSNGPKNDEDEMSVSVCFPDHC